MTKEQALALAAARLRAQEFDALKTSQKTHEAIKQQIANDPISVGARKFPTDGMDGSNLVRGVGSVFDKYASGAQQMLPPAAPTTPAAFSGAPAQAIQGLTQQAIQQNVEQDAAETDRRRLNEPLERTPAGKLGQLAGEVAVLAPTTLLPGAQGARGAAMGGGGLGAVQPTTGDESRAANAGMSATVGGGAAYGMNRIAQALAGRRAAAPIAQQQNAERDAIINQGREAGFVFPPASVNPSFLNTTLESVGGKMGTERAASITNQRVVNALVRDELGLPENAPITARALEGLRQQAGQAYADVAAISPEASALVQRLRDARYDARAQQRYYDRSANPEADRAAQAARAQATQIEGELETLASAYLRQPELVQRMREARTLIAKTHNVEDALSVGGNVDARRLGRSEYLTGNLRQIGDVADQFPKAVQLPEGFGSPNVGAGKALASALMTTAGGGAMGPAGMLAGAAPFVAPPAARSIMFSDAMQNSLIPQYGPGLAARLAQQLVENQQLRRALPLAAAPYAPQVQQ